MRISTKIILSIENGAVLKREYYEYSGPIVECFSAGASGSASKSKNKSQQTSQSESGTKFNEDFYNRALQYVGTTGAAGKHTITTSPKFDAARYLEENPDVKGWGMMKKFSSPEEGARAHWEEYGKAEGRKFPGDPGTTAEVEIPDYNPAYVPGAYTGAQFTSVAPRGFQQLEQSLYGTQQSKLRQAYDQATAQQREELAQAGALNSPSQYLEGSARSSLDRSYLQNLQQAARDAFQGRLGVETAEAGRKTTFDLNQAQNRTAFDTGEAGRETQFNEQTAARLLELWLKKIGILIEAGRYSQGESQGTSSGKSSSGSGGMNASFMSFGGSGSS